MIIAPHADCLYCYGYGCHGGPPVTPCDRCEGERIHRCDACGDWCHEGWRLHEPAGDDDDDSCVCSWACALAIMEVPYLDDHEVPWICVDRRHGPEVTA